MELDDNIGSLEKKRRRLYASKKNIITPNRYLPRSEDSDVPHSWKESKKPVKHHQHVHFALAFFWVALSFFIIAVGGASYLFLSGGRSVSTANVAITVQGPTTIAGGDTVSLFVSVTNNNPIKMEDTSLALSFPAGTRLATNVTKSITHKEESLGTIEPGAHFEQSVKVILFGGQGDTVTIPISLQFKTKGSNAVLVKKTSYTLSIVATPLSVSVDAPSEITAGQPFSITATVRSNATIPITDVALKANYPTGFTLTKTSLNPVGDIFSLGTFTPGQTVQVRISGTLAGQNKEQRVFRLAVGTTDTSKPSLAISYMTQSATITIARPFLATVLSVNGSISGNTVVSAGVPIRATLAWKNTLDVPITNARIEVKISGTPFDQKINVSSGQYQSANQTIVFSRDSDSSFALLAPGASGIGAFTFTPLAPTATSTNKDIKPSIHLSVSVSGQRLGPDNVAQTISSTVTRSIKMSTRLAIDAYAIYSSGEFANSGPIPPRANEATTYTIVWSVRNTLNDVAGASVTANLPASVSFIGNVSPNNNSVTYDEGAHTVTWNIGDFSAGSSRTSSFQVSLTPSTSQYGIAPTLINEPLFVGFDRFAQVNVSATVNAVTTDLSHDTKYQNVNASNVQ